VREETLRTARPGIRRTEQGRRGIRAAAAILVAALAACEQEEPTDETPEGAVRLLVGSLQARDGDAAYALLAPETRRELARRARAASLQAGRTVAPSEMIAVERHVPRWEIRDVAADGQGDRADVVVRGAAATERAVVQAVRVDGRWRVVLPL